VKLHDEDGCAKQDDYTACQAAKNRQKIPCEKITAFIHANIVNYIYNGKHDA
jgi:hypothetical protein